MTLMTQHLSEEDASKLYTFIPYTHFLHKNAIAKLQKGTVVERLLKGSNYYVRDNHLPVLHLKTRS